MASEFGSEFHSVKSAFLNVDDNQFYVIQLPKYSVVYAYLGDTKVGAVFALDSQGKQTAKVKALIEDGDFKICKQ